VFAAAPRGSRAPHLENAPASERYADAQDARRVHLVFALQHLATPRLDEARDWHLHVRPLVCRGEEEGLPKVVCAALQRRREGPGTRECSAACAPVARSSCRCAAWRCTSARLPVGASKLRACQAGVQAGARTRTRNSSVLNASKSSSCSSCSARTRSLGACAFHSRLHRATHLSSAHAAKAAAPQCARSACSKRRLGYLGRQRAVQHCVPTCAVSERARCAPWSQPAQRWRHSLTLRTAGRKHERRGRHAAVLGVGIRLQRERQRNEGCVRRAARQLRLTFHRATSSGVSNANSVRSDGGVTTFTAAQQRKGARQSTDTGAGCVQGCAGRA